MRIPSHNIHNGDDLDSKKLKIQFELPTNVAPRHPTREPNIFKYKINIMSK